VILPAGCCPLTGLCLKECLKDLYYYFFFSLYLRDFGKALQHCKHNFYADDLLIYMHAELKNIYEAICGIMKILTGQFNGKISSILIELFNINS